MMPVNRPAAASRARRAVLLSLAFGAIGQAAVAASLDEARQLHRAGRYQEALTAYEAVVASATSEPAAIGVAHNNSCVIRTDLGDYAAAVADCRRALDRRMALGDDRGVARTLNNLGLALQSLGEYADARRRFSRALEINLRIGETYAAAINQANLGGLATLTGDYDAAIAYHREVARMADLHSDEPWAAGQAAVARVNRGVVLEKLGAFEEALELYREVLNEGRLDPVRRALTLVNAGVIYRNLGDPVAALALFDEAAEVFRAEGNPSGLSNALLNRALALHLNLASPAVAESAYREALDVARATGDRPEEIQDLFYLGRLLLETDRAAEALELFERCLQLAEESGAPEGRWSALEGIGRARLALGDLGASWEALSRALSEIETVRLAVTRGRLRSGYFGDKRPVFEVAVEVLARLHAAEPEAGYAEQALEIVQRAKARDLLDALGPGVTSAPLAAAEVRDRVGDELVIELFVASGRLYRWLVDRRGTSFADLGAAPPLLDAVGAVHTALAAGELPLAADLETLSAVLLTGLPADLEAYRTLRVAPDARFFYLPFELLSAPGARPAPLVTVLPISYLPSASSLAVAARRGRDAATGVVAIGAPVEGEPGEEPPSRRSLRERFRLSPLAAAPGELERVGAALDRPALILRGPDATEEALRTAAAGGARVFHLATHTVVDERSDRGPVVLLSPAGGDDGLLFPEEIAGLELHTDLVVLASCSTSAGAEHSGQALASLTGSFLAAGAPAVVATLWDVGDRATAAFMDQFYYQLGRGLRPEEALREAKMRMRAAPEWSRPALWGAYVLVGSGIPVAGGTGTGPGLLVVVGLVLAALAWWLLARRRSTSRLE